MNTSAKSDARAAGLSDDDRRQILGMPELHDAQLLAAEWDAMNEAYAEDVLVMLPGLPDIQGKEALRSFQEGFPPVKLSEVRIEELDGCGGLAYARFRYRMQMEMLGAPVEETGRGIWILRKGDEGRWRVALDISAPDAAPTA